MLTTLELSTGVNIRCYTDSRFKQGRLTIQFIRPTCREEAPMNALLPAVLLRGCRDYPNLRAISLATDDLYGASVGDVVRRIGDLHTTGLGCSFTEDRFALEGDRIMAPAVALLEKLLTQPLTENGFFCRSFVEGEKKNLLADMEAQRNDKAVYAANRLFSTMCSADSFRIPRIGEPEQLAAVNEEKLYQYYQQLLREAPVEVFYVGSAPAQEVARLVEPIFSGLGRSRICPLPAQTPFRDGGSAVTRESLPVSQSRLSMGFVTPITGCDPRFPAMQVANTLFGGGMTSKLFMNVREKLSLCYSIDSSYYSTKGIVTVNAGIDGDQEAVTRQEILTQLQACQQGDITPGELAAAKEALLSGLRSIPDSPRSIEAYYFSGLLAGHPTDPALRRQMLEAVTVESTAEAAATLQLHSEYFLKGVGQ